MVDTLQFQDEGKFFSQAALSAVLTVEISCIHQPGTGEQFHRVICPDTEMSMSGHLCISQQYRISLMDSKRDTVE